MRVLLTGIAGFAGSFLAEHILNTTDAELHGIIHRHDRRIQHLHGQLVLHRGDLRNSLWISEVVETIQPDVALHLAAWSDVGGSWQQPWTTYELNIQCQLNLLEALRRWQPECRTLITSSNEIYGLVQSDDLPTDESAPLRPNSPYGVSKITQDMMGLQYWNSHRLPVIRARSFNHVGPGQSDDFAASAFARQIAEIELGLREPVVRVGNLSTERDFTDVRDIVRAYWQLITLGSPGECYNVGSGRPLSIQWILDTLLEFTDAAVDVELDTQRLRPSDVPVSFCNNTRLVEATGWRPQINLRASLLDLLTGWREQLRARDGER